MCRGVSTLVLLEETSSERKMTYQSRCHAHESHEDVRETHLGFFLVWVGEVGKCNRLQCKKTKMGISSKRARFEKTV